MSDDQAISSETFSDQHDPEQWWPAQVEAIRQFLVQQVGFIALADTDIAIAPRQPYRGVDLADPSPAGRIDMKPGAAVRVSLDKPFHGRLQSRNVEFARYVDVELYGFGFRPIDARSIEHVRLQRRQCPGSVHAYSRPVGSVREFRGGPRGSVCHQGSEAGGSPLGYQVFRPDRQAQSPRAYGEHNSSDTVSSEFGEAVERLDTRYLEYQRKQLAQYDFRRSVGRARCGAVLISRNVRHRRYLSHGGRHCCTNHEAAGPDQRVGARRQPVMKP